MLTFYFFCYNADFDFFQIFDTSQIHLKKHFEEREVLHQSDFRTIQQVRQWIFCHFHVIFLFLLSNQVDIFFIYLVILKVIYIYFFEDST